MLIFSMYKKLVLEGEGKRDTLLDKVPKYSYIEGVSPNVYSTVT